MDSEDIFGLPDRHNKKIKLEGWKGKSIKGTYSHLMLQILHLESLNKIFIIREKTSSQAQSFSRQETRGGVFTAESHLHFE